MFHVIARPVQRVLVIRRQFAETQPVAQRHFRGIGNTHAGLQRRAHQRHTAKGP
ncbi:hypothetical protein D9M71_156100 [compost metagenome]